MLQPAVPVLGAVPGWELEHAASIQHESDLELEHGRDEAGHLRGPCVGQPAGSGHFRLRRQRRFDVHPDLTAAVSFDPIPTSSSHAPVTMKMNDDIMPRPTA